MNADEVKKYFDYDPDTGYFTRKIRTCNKVKIGDEVGSISNQTGIEIAGIRGRTNE